MRGEKEQIKARENYLSIVIRILILAYGGRPRNGTPAEAIQPYITVSKKENGQKKPSGTKTDYMLGQADKKAVVCIRNSGG